MTTSKKIVVVVYTLHKLGLLLLCLNGVDPHRFFIIGACSALDTLASQAFGAGDRPGVICWAVASTVVLSLMAVPMAALLYIADSVADVVFQQPPEICEASFPFAPCCAKYVCNLLGAARIGFYQGHLVLGICSWSLKCLRRFMSLLSLIHSARQLCSLHFLVSTA